MDVDMIDANTAKEFVFNNLRVRVFVKNNEPWFVAKDVCDVLEISNPNNVYARLDEDEKDSIHTTDSISRGHDVIIVSEPGLYSIVLSSRKPEAKAFKRWITHEVIPSIRKHGAYMTQPTIDKLVDNPDLIIELCNKLKEERKLRAEEEQRRAVVEMERAEAIRTKAMIGTRREATAMNRASQLSKENTRLKDEIGLSKRFATIKKVQEVTGRDFSWKPLKEYSEQHEIDVRKVADANYARGVNAYSAESWHAVYGVDLVSLCS